MGKFGPGNQVGFVGFELPDGDFGWMQVRVSDFRSPGFPNEVELIDFAYNNVAGAPITAGDTGVPEPNAAALGLFAMGASGLIAWRRRRKEVSSE